MGRVLDVEIGLDRGIGMGGEVVVDLLRPLETEIQPAHHQKDRDRGGQEGRQEEKPRQEDHDLVADRALGDFPDDRQFPLCRKAADIFRGHGRVVDQDAHGLATDLGRRPRNVIHRRRRHLRDRRDIVQKCQKPAHTRPHRSCPPKSRGLTRHDKGARRHSGRSATGIVRPVVANKGVFPLTH